MNTVLPELLSEIFWHFVWDEINTVFAPRGPLHTPLLLGRVCSRWRTVSISTPELWSTISIGGHTRNIPANYRKDMEAATMWISRSGRCPLTFAVNDMGFQIEDYGGAIWRVVDFVVSQSCRWRTVRVNLHGEFLKVLLVPVMKGNTPMLEDLQCISSGVALGFDSRPFVLSSTPRLEELQVFGVPFQVDFGDQIHHVRFIDVRLPTRIKFGKQSLADLLQCLTQCPSLTWLGLRIWESSQPATLQHPLPPTIALTNLHTLLLTFGAAIDPYLLFDRLFLPSLTNLQLVMSRCTQTNWPYLATMLKRSQPPLTIVNLRGVPMTEQTFVECLSYAPKLTELGVSGINCSDITLASLTINDTEAGSNSAILCPYLSFVGFGEPSHFSASALRAMILSRWPGDQASTSEDITVSPEKTLEGVRCDSELVDDMLLDPDVFRCVKNGLTVAEWEEEVELIE